MLEILKFIFIDPLHFFGVITLMGIATICVCGIIETIKEKK